MEPDATAPLPFVPNLIPPRTPAGKAVTVTEIESEMIADAPAAEDGDDADPVPPGLEQLADALATALSAVMAAASKTAEAAKATHVQPADPAQVGPATEPRPIAPAAQLAALQPPGLAREIATEMAGTDTQAMATPLATSPVPPEMAVAIDKRSSPRKTEQAPPVAAPMTADGTEPPIGEQPSPPTELFAPRERAAPAPAPIAVAASDAAAAALQTNFLPVSTASTTGAPLAAPTEIVIEHHLDLARDGEWLDQLARDIVRSANHDAQLRFRLNPEHLGSLGVEIANRAEGTAVRLTADTEAARTILTDAQPRLVAEARAQGLRISETHVDLGGQSGFAGQPGQQQRQQGASQPVFIRTQQGHDEPAAETPRAAAERYA
jgi:flagellar hook-length control protein FliK